MKKMTASPVNISLMGGLYVSILNGLILTLLFYLDKINMSIVELVAVWFILSLASYLVFYNIVKSHIQSKLDIVYRAIHRYHHKNKIGWKMAVSENVLRQADLDVSQWIREVEESVQIQTDLADYRRQFMSNFSHEIKSPIFNIQGYIDTLLDGAVDDDKVRLVYLNQASKNVTRLVSIVDDLTTISKLEYNQVVLNMTSFNIVDLVVDVFEELSFLAGEISNTLILNDNGSNYVGVLGDKEAIHQVFVNLITNALKYGKFNGITTINLLDMDTYLIIQIIDTGIGIESRHIDHLCDRFYRVSESRSILRGGTGLGLSIVKHILDAHGQNLNITSVFGEGSVFAFHLEKV